MSCDETARPNVQQAVPFFGVHDIEASLRFYVDGLGFAVSQKWVHEGKLRWCWLELGGAGLMLQEFWTEGRHANVPADKLGVGVAVNFICDDALLIYCEAMARGLEVDEPFVGNHMWVTGLRDPDGYELFFESTTDVPEEMRYSEWEGASL